MSQSMRKLSVSHISEDAAVAAWLKKTLRGDFLEMFDVFVSSDTESIEAGLPWFDTVREEIASSHALITRCSAESLPRPWVNFEFGAAWMVDKPNIPVCHNGLTLADLPVPLSLYQAITLDDPDGLRRLYNTLVKWSMVRICAAKVRSRLAPGASEHRTSLSRGASHERPTNAKARSQSGLHEYRHGDSKCRGRRVTTRLPASGP